MAAQPKITAVQLWGAFLLTVGEFGTAIWFVFHEGHYFAFYLACTYAMRETQGGRHYHDIVLKGVRALHRRKKAEHDETDTEGA